MQPEPEFYAPGPIKVLLGLEDLPGFEDDSKDGASQIHFDALCRYGRLYGHTAWVNWTDDFWLFRLEQVIFEFKSVDSARSFIEDEKQRIVLLGEPLSLACHQDPDIDELSSVRSFYGKDSPFKIGPETTIFYSSRNGVGVSRLIFRIIRTQENVPFDEVKKICVAANKFLRYAGMRA